MGIVWLAQVDEYWSTDPTSLPRPKKGHESQKRAALHPVPPNKECPFCLSYLTSESTLCPSGIIETYCQGYAPWLSYPCLIVWTPLSSNGTVWRFPQACSTLETSSLTVLPAIYRVVPKCTTYKGEHDIYSPLTSFHSEVTALCHALFPYFYFKMQSPEMILCQWSFKVVNVNSTLSLLLEKIQKRILANYPYSFQESPENQGEKE